LPAAIETRACAVCKGGSVCVGKFRAAGLGSLLPDAGRCARRAGPCLPTPTPARPPSFAATSRSSTLAPPFVPDQGVAGSGFGHPLRLAASALEPRLEPDRGVHCPCRPSPFYMPLLDAVAATFKAAAPALRDDPCSIAKATAQRQVLDVARSPATSSGRWRRPHAAKSRAQPFANDLQNNFLYPGLAHAGLWISADAPASPSSPTRCQHCRCPGPALRCVRLTGTSSAVTTFGRRHRCFSSASIDSHGDPDQSLTH
jgi:hypothetical protein